VTLGIINTYDKQKMREPHRRAIARAGAVAAAFEANLALFGFPLPEDVHTPAQLAAWSRQKTTIGQDAGYFVELAESGRVGIFEEAERGFPPQLGTPIMTTSKPRAEKAVTLSVLALRVGGGESVLLVFGLGPHGLPETLRRACAADFDVTEEGYSLETATAIGAVASAVWHATQGVTPRRS
jgi:hypothetical protein